MGQQFSWIRPCGTNLITSLDTHCGQFANQEHEICVQRQKDDPSIDISQHGQVLMSDHTKWNDFVVSSLVTDGFIDAGFIFCTSFVISNGDEVDSQHPSSS